MVYLHGKAGGLEARVVHFCNQPVEEREYLVEGHKAIEVGREGLIEGAIAPAQRNCLLRDRGLIGIANAILISIQEHVIFQSCEPVEDGDISVLISGNYIYGCVDKRVWIYV